MKPKKSRSEKAVKRANQPAPPSPAKAAQSKLPRQPRTAAKAKVAKQPALKVKTPPAGKPTPAKAKAVKAPKKAVKAPKKAAVKLAGTALGTPAALPKPLKRKQPVGKRLLAKAAPKPVIRQSRQPVRPVSAAAAPVPKVAPASIPPAAAEPARPSPAPREKQQKSPHPSPLPVERGEGEATPHPSPLPVGRGEGARPGRPALKVPPILLEGDEPSAPPVTGPGQKYALGPTPPVTPPAPEEGELPEAYGTGRLLLTARDPHCLYAHWDIAAEQQRRYNALSVHRHLVLRVYQEALAGRPITELPVHPESTYWFIHVDRAGVRYAAELGYYQPDQQWRTIAAAEPVMAPPETIAEERTVQFATIPPEVPLAQVAERAREVAVKAAAPPPTPPPPPPVPPAMGPEEGVGRGETRPYQGEEEGGRGETRPYQGEEGGRGGTRPYQVDQPTAPPVPPAAQFETDRQSAWRPAPMAGPPPAWTPAQERALAEVVSTALVRQEWVGSAEITELIRRQAGQAGPAGPAPEAISSLAAAQFGAPAPAGVPVSISSPMGEAAPAISGPRGEENLGRRGGFWFNVNAELIIYGATEPDAKVSIGGRQIRLRPDGTFSYRFALPDGNYTLPIAAISVDGEVRRAELDFHRGTLYYGEVGAHPQDPALQAPRAENVS